MKRLKELLLKREFILLLLIIILCVIFGTRSKVFLTLPNLSGVFLSISVYSIVATGLTILFIGGGFDISTGQHLGFLGVLTGVMLGNGAPIYLTIIIVLILGTFNGFIIGLCVAKLGVNSFIATLGASFMFAGLGLVIAYTSKVGGYIGNFGDFPAAFLNIARRTFFKVEFINIYMIIIVFILYILISKNVFFRQSHYVGGNANVSKLMGIKVTVVTVFNFVLMGLLVATSTILRASRVGSTSCFDGGESMSLLIIAAVILGGASLRGGSGSILGTFLGVILLTVMDNGLILLKIDVFYVDIIVGFILLVSVMLDRFLKRSIGTSLNVSIG